MALFRDGPVVSFNLSDDPGCSKKAGQTCGHSRNGKKGLPIGSKSTPVIDASGILMAEGEKNSSEKLLPTSCNSRFADLIYM
jgi:hypothetical protein